MPNNFAKPHPSRKTGVHTENQTPGKTRAAAREADAALAALAAETEAARIATELAAFGIVTLPVSDAENAANIAAEAEQADADKPEPVAEAPAIDKAAARSAARTAARSLYLAADTAVSIPIKALSAFKAYRADLGALRCNTPTTRQAAALAIACLASGQTLPSTDAEFVTFNRRFSHPVTGDACSIENGCAADCVSVGLASYSNEAFTVSGKQSNTIRGLLGKRLADIAKPAPIATA